MDDSINAVFDFLKELAKGKRLISYDELNHEAGINSDDILFIALGEIAYVCETKKYPPITAIVVKEDNLTPGEDFWVNQDCRYASDKDSWWAKKVRDVFLFNWGIVKCDLSRSSGKRIRTL